MKQTCNVTILIDGRTCTACKQLSHWIETCWKPTRIEQGISISNRKYVALFCPSSSLTFPFNLVSRLPTNSISICSPYKSYMNTWWNASWSLMVVICTVTSSHIHSAYHFRSDYFSRFCSTIPSKWHIWFTDWSVWPDTLPQWFGHPRAQIPSDMGIPGRDAQNTDSIKYSRLGQVNSFEISKSIYVLTKCCLNKCLVYQQNWQLKVLP